MSRLRLKIGDVFSVPIDESRVGVGQVVATYGKSAFYFAIFDVVAPDAGKVDLDAAVSGRLLFLALSMDAKLFAGHWSVLGHRPVSEQTPLPAFKVAVGPPEDMYVEDFSGQKRRPATRAEAELLPYRTVVAPVRLERALRAKLGLEPWLEAYSDFAPNETKTTARLFETGLFSGKTKGTTAAVTREQAVIIHYTLTGDDHGTVREREAVFELEKSLTSTIEDQALGELDGNEFGGGEAVLYCYGPDAGRLFAGIEAALRAFPPRPAHALLRYGDVSDLDAPEQRIDL